MHSTPYRERRRQLARRLTQAGGGVALVLAAPTQRRNSVNDHPYRHDSYFHYLTGFDEPHSGLLLCADGRSTLFCQTPDPAQEIWEGYRLGPQAAPGTLGVDEAFGIEQITELLPERLSQHAIAWSLFDESNAVDPRLAGWVGAAQARTSPPPGHQPGEHRNLGPLLDEMRLRKDAQEIDTMRRAARISAAAHARAMQFCAARFAQSPGGGVPEFEIEAELLHEFRRHGAQSPAYPSIVAAGANACVLHYAAGNRLLRAGELCLIDAGCELDGYASDITRTFPANGRFSSAQRELYDIVVASLDAAVEATRPGARMRDAHHAAVRVLTQGMLDTGLLSRDKHGDADAVIASGAYRQFYMHSTGHWLGRDVHDVGDYLSADEEAFEQPDGLGGTVVKKPSRHLQPGMVVTIEPGLYVRPGPDVPERYWHIGIRIEDDALITETGCELISRDVPVKADEIEALMAQRG